MKKLTALLLSLTFMLSLTGCTSKLNETTNIPKLSDISNYTQEQLEEKIIGISEEYLHHYWGKPDQSFFGVWGDIWQLSAKNNQEFIAVYYDKDGTVESITFDKNGTVESITFDKDGTVESITFDKDETVETTKADEQLAEQTETDKMWDRIPMVRVNGKLYYDTGKESTGDERCGNMDGQITTTVDGTEIPMEDNQSNFGSGFSYQYGKDDTIEIYMNEKWFIFEYRGETE